METKYGFAPSRFWGQRPPASSILTAAKPHPGFWATTWRFWFFQIGPGMTSGEAVSVGGGFFFLEDFGVSRTLLAHFPCSYRTKFGTSGKPTFRATFSCRNISQYRKGDIHNGWSKMRMKNFSSSRHYFRNLPRSCSREILHTHLPYLELKRGQNSAS